MGFTQTYSDLVVAVSDVNYKISTDYMNRNMALGELDKLLKFTEDVNKLEGERGNLATWYNPGYNPNEEWHNSTTPPEGTTFFEHSEAQSLQFELDMIKGAILNLISVYSDDKLFEHELKLAKYPNLRNGHEDRSLTDRLTQLGETSNVPLSVAEDKKYIINYLSESIKQFIKYTAKITPEHLTGDIILMQRINELAGCISLEVTEMYNEEVYKGVTSWDEYEESLERLDMHNHKVVEYINNQLEETGLTPSN